MGLVFLWCLFRTIADNIEYGCMIVLLRLGSRCMFLGMMGWALQDTLQLYLSVRVAVEHLSDVTFIGAGAEFLVGLIGWLLSERWWDVALEDAEEPVVSISTRPPG